jgi:hypothetical protein
MHSNDKWIIGKPGGPSGPFWSVVSRSGEVIAMQITEDKWAELLVKTGNAVRGDFNTVHEAGKRLRSIIDNDVSSKCPIIDEGSEDYIVRCVVEALYA